MARRHLADGEAHQLPLAVVQAAKLFWDAARREADQVQVQKSEAARRELELQREALARKESELTQREASFEQARVALDKALASSRQAVAAIEAQLHAQQQESARLLSDSEAEVRRLRKALEEPWPARKPCARRRRWHSALRNATPRKPSNATSPTSAGSWLISIASGWPGARLPPIWRRSSDRHTSPGQLFAAQRPTRSTDEKTRREARV